MLGLIFQFLILPAQTLAPTATGDLFATVRHSVLARTRVPLRLPRTVENDGAELYVSGKADAGKYRVDISTMPNCNRGDVCSFGFVGGERKPGASIQGKRVKLARKVMGFYTPFECHAYCTMALLSWREGDYIYTVALKAGNVAELMKMANSAIQVSTGDGAGL